ncbi:MAG: OmpL47-type beta-barrel domain-containing protein [Candidatus Natronoplasma sp.]
MDDKMKNGFVSELSFVFTLIFVTAIVVFLMLSFWGPFLANGGISEAKTFFSREEDLPSREEEGVKSVASWEQWSQSDFKQGDSEDLDLDSEPGKVKLDTDTIQIGAAEAAEQGSRGGYYYWPKGSTFLGCRDDFRADRGGKIREFRINVGDDPDLAGDIELKVLRPTDPDAVNPGESAEFYAAQSEIFSNLNPGQINERTGLDIPIEKEDRLGLYALGDIAAVALTGNNGYWSHDGEVTSTPTEMGHISDDDAITTLEAEVETHRDEGVHESNVHDAGQHMYEWESISWDADVPQGSNLTIETRTSANGQDWTSWEEAENEGNVPGDDTHQYIQYRATFTSATGRETPSLNSIRIEYRVDEDPPDIEHSSLDEWQAEGGYTITASVQDGGSGLAENPSTYYSIDEGSSWNELTMGQVGDELYETEIPDLNHSTEVRYYIEAENEAGLVATSPDEDQYYPFKVDKESPETEPVLSGEEGDDGWFASQVEVQLDASDGDSGVGTTWYRLDDGWEEYAQPIELQQSGIYEVEYYSDDQVGNEEGVDSVEVKIDMSPPEVEVIKPEPSGENGWYLEDVQVEISATDENSDIETIEYRFGEEEWRTYESEIDLDESGEFQLEYRCFDRAGNEERGTTQIKIDLEDPQASAEVLGEEGNKGWYVTAPEVELNAQDNISGVSHINYRIDGEEEWSEYQETITLEDGIYTVEYHSVDKAGRESEVNEKEIKVDTSSPDLYYETDPPYEQGWVNSPGTISVDSEDELSGVSEVSCRINRRGEWENETRENSGDIGKMNTTFDVSMSGELEVELYVKDEAGNEYIEDFEYLMDLEGPRIESAESSPTVWRNDLTVSVEAKDYNSDIDRVILEYDTGDGWKEKEMNLENGEYVATISGGEVGFSDVDYRIVVRDGAGNVEETETKVADVGINWWYFVPIPIAVVLLALFVFWKKRREKHEKLMPIKESKFSKIREKRGRKLKELKSQRAERTADVGNGGRSSTPPPGARGETMPVSALSQTSSEDCDICNSPTDSESRLKCECGNVYHNDCLMVEGECPECERDYAAVKSFTEEGGSDEGTEEEERGETEETTEDGADIKILADETSTEPEEKVKKEAEEMKEIAKEEEEPLDEMESEESETIEDEEELEERVEQDEQAEDIEEEPSEVSEQEEKMEQDKDEEIDEEQEEEGGKEDLEPEENLDERSEEEKESIEEESTEEEDKDKGPTKCPICNNDLEPGADKCWACGADLDEEE